MEIVDMPIAPQLSTQYAADQATAFKTQRRQKIVYWTVTLVLFVPSILGAIPEVFSHGPAGVVTIMISLGYPLYLMKILGTAKILGGFAILWGKLPRLKEWAYAGYSFEFLGATASHTLARDAAHAIFPMLFFVLLLTSYLSWHKTAATPLPFR